MANLFNNFLKLKIGKAPSDRSDLPIVDEDQEITTNLDASDNYSRSQLNSLRTIAQDRQGQYNAYDEMSQDTVIASALEIYADDATQYDEKGRIIWVESEDEDIARAGNRLLDIMEIPEKAWKHIYTACKYGDCYLKLYTQEELSHDDLKNKQEHETVKVINDKVSNPLDESPSLVEYVEEVKDPSTVFDLRKRGKSAGFVVTKGDSFTQNLNSALSISNATSVSNDIEVYPPDKLVHIMLPEVLSRQSEEITIDYDEDHSTTYEVVRGKSILYDVYPIQQEIKLLEDTLLLNRLTRSSLIRILEIEVGDMPKKEVNPYLRRVKNLIEQHISMDKSTGKYSSYNSPGPIDNVIYVPVKNGKGSININNLGGDVNVRDIVDIDYFNNKRAGALKIPKSYLDSSDGDNSSGFDNGGSLTRLSIRYARTIKRIQTAYIRAITTLLNLFWLDKKLDYVNKFTVRMTSPSTQEDLERLELLSNQVDLISSIMDLTSSLEGDTQKKILEMMVKDHLKMPEMADIIHQDLTPSGDIDIEGSGGPDIDIDIDAPTDNEEQGSNPPEVPSEDEFTQDEFDAFTDL